MDGLLGYAIAPSFLEFQLARPSYRCGVVLFFLELRIGFLSGVSSFPFFKTQNASMPVHFFFMFLPLSFKYKRNNFVGSPNLEWASIVSNRPRLSLRVSYLNGS